VSYAKTAEPSRDAVWHWHSGGPKKTYTVLGGVHSGATCCWIPLHHA